MLLSEATAKLIEDIKNGLDAKPQYQNAHGRPNYTIKGGVGNGSEPSREQKQNASRASTSIFVSAVGRGKKSTDPHLRVYNTKIKLVVYVHTRTNGEGTAACADTLLDVINSILYKTGDWELEQDHIAKPIKKDEKAFLGYVGIMVVHTTQLKGIYKGEEPVLPE